MKTLVDPVPEMHGKLILRGRKMPNLKVGVGKKKATKITCSKLPKSLKQQVTVLFTYFHLNAEDLTLTLVIMIIMISW